MIEWNCTIQCRFKHFWRVKGNWNHIKSVRWLRVVWRSRMCRGTRRPIWSWTTDPRGLCVPSASWKRQGNNNDSRSMKILFPFIPEPRGCPPSCCLQDLAESGMLHPHTGLQVCVSYYQTNDILWPSKGLSQDKLTETDQWKDSRRINQSDARLYTNKSVKTKWC